MWNYEKRLQYPVKITQTNPKIAQIILTQFGGPDGELAASMRYLAQRYTMPYKEVTGILTDIGTEESVQKWYQLFYIIIGRYCEQTNLLPPSVVCLLKLSKLNSLNPKFLAYSSKRCYSVCFCPVCPSGTLDMNTVFKVSFKA